MLNGKFFTGLPPAMIERSNASSGRVNRLESHFFWPDETQTDSVPETRLKRRHSLQPCGAAAKPQVQPQRVGRRSRDDDVDAREMFKKEFTRSSIQFYDYIEEPPERSEGQQQLCMEGTTPSTTQQPGGTTNIVAKEYNNGDNKRPDDLNNSRNNVRAQRMDRNDKKDVERNAKNSPKLQNKNVRNLLAMEELLEADAKTNARERGGEAGQGIALDRYRTYIEDNDSELLATVQARGRRSHEARNHEYRAEWTRPEGFQDYIENGIRRMEVSPRLRSSGSVVNARKQMVVDSPGDCNDRRNNSMGGRKPLHTAESFPRNMDARCPRNVDGERSHSYSQQKVDAVTGREQGHASKALWAPPRPHRPANNVDTVAMSEKPYQAQKHLRSSICFDDSVSSPTMTTAPPTPTTCWRRSARRSAVQRVSVGLPD